MYNEDDTLFARTMHGVMKNIAYLCKRDRSKIWGKDGWKKVVICIVSDGRQKINSRTLSAIAAIGAYQEGVATNVVNGKEVSAHIYEYTTQSARFDFHRLIFLSFFRDSLYHRVEQDRGRREGDRTCPDHILPQGEEPEEDQLASLVLQRLWPYPPAERLRAS
jgi:hypothetical protein